MGKISPCPSGSAGNLGYTEDRARMAQDERTLSRSSKGGGEWEFFDLPQQWDLHYKDLTFHLKPFSFKHTGLFPEQAANWDWFGDKSP